MVERYWQLQAFPFEGQRKVLDIQIDDGTVKNLMRAAGDWLRDIWLLPRGVRSWRPTVIVSSPQKIPAGLVACCGPGTMLSISRGLRDLLKQLAPECFQFLPMWPVHKNRLGMEELWIAHPVRMADCLNLSRSKIERTSYPLQYYIPGEIVIDPTRAPKHAAAFVPRYRLGDLIVTNDVYLGLLKARVRGMYFRALKSAPESNHDRKQWEHPSESVAYEKPTEFPAPTLDDVRAALAAEAAKPGLIGFLASTLGAKPKAAVKVGTGASVSDIKTAEKRLRVSLTDAYRSFLLDHGSAELEGVEIFGLGRAAGTGLPNQAFHEYTEQMRKGKSDMDWPAHMVAIAEDGRGGCFCLDLSKTKNDECPVVYFDHELAKIDAKTGRITPIFERVKPSFKSWIKAVAENGEPGPF